MVERKVKEVAPAVEANVKSLNELLLATKKELAVKSFKKKMEKQMKKKFKLKMLIFVL